RAARRRPAVNRGRFPDLGLCSSGTKVLGGRGTGRVPVRSPTEPHRGTLMPTTLRESRAIWLLATLAIVAALYFAKAVFVPLAVAILLTFVLAPPFRLLLGWGLPRAAAAPIIVALAFIFILAIAGVLGQQLTQLADRLPQYELTITEKIQKLRDSVLGGGTFQRMSRFLSDVNQQISGKQSEQPATSTSNQS